jgi:hypothetical protein|tara:strand:- start:416 stop:661 length:246 start_codon:yes stop_codon:yes gene_type:complete
MSSEIHKYIETALDKQDVLFNAEVINFPKETNVNNVELKKLDNQNVWKINDETNVDQLKAVIGICFMLGALLIMGLYSTLV